MCRTVLQRLSEGLSANPESPPRTHNLLELASRRLLLSRDRLGGLSSSIEELLILDLTASARRRSAKKELTPVGELDHLTDCPLGAIPRLESFNDDPLPGGNAVLLKPNRSKAFGLPDPSHNRAVGALHIDMNPGMGVDPFHLLNRTPQRDRGFDVELRCKRMMGTRRRQYQKQTGARRQNHRLHRHSAFPFQIHFGTFPAASAAALSAARAPLSVLATP